MAKQCVALTDAHCRNAEILSTYGQCTAVRGKCLAVTDSECRGSEIANVAAVHGSKWCVRNGSGFRLFAGVPVRDTPCAADGLCVSQRAVCSNSRVMSSSDGCREHGRCSEDGGGLPRPMRIAQSHKTANDAGRASLQRRGQCTVTSCNKACRQYNCSRRGDRCTQRVVVTADGEICKQTGACTASTKSNAALGHPIGICIVASDSDCMRSAACKEHGKCTAQGEDVDGVVELYCGKRAVKLKMGECLSGVG